MMEKEPNGFFKRKTTWAALSSIGAGLGGFMTKTADPMTAITLVLQGLMALGIRSSIAKQTEP